VLQREPWKGVSMYVDGTRRSTLYQGPRSSVVLENEVVGAHNVEFVGWFSKDP
jgi:hypothetical protein